jgi:hypothetical protein
MKALPLPRRIHQSKIVSKFVGVRKRLKLRQHSAEDTCPVCLLATPSQVVEETVQHLYKWPGTKEVWEKHMKQLTEWLIMVGTVPAVREVIVASFQAWRSCTPPPTTANLELQQVLQRQLALGWESAFEGRFALGWTVIQEQHYRATNAKPFHNGLRWLANLIRKLFDVSWDLWQHRNSVLHDKADGLRIRELRQQVKDELRTGPGRSQRLKLLFKTRQETIMKRTDTQLEAWLYQVKTERDLLAQQTPAEREHLRQREFMRRFFQPTQARTTRTTGQTP